MVVDLYLPWQQHGGVRFSVLKVPSLACNSSPTVRITLSMFRVDPEAHLLMIRRNSGGSFVTRTDGALNNSPPG